MDRSPLFRVLLYIVGIIGLTQVPMSYDVRECSDGSLCATRGVPVAGLVLERYTLTPGTHLLGLALGVLVVLTTWLVLRVFRRHAGIGASWSRDTLLLAAPVALVTQVELVMSAGKASRIAGALAVAALILLARRDAAPAPEFLVPIAAVAAAAFVWLLLYPMGTGSTDMECGPSNPHCNSTWAYNAFGWFLDGTRSGEDPAVVEVVLKIRAWAVALTVPGVVFFTRVVGLEQLRGRAAPGLPSITLP